ncbi:hypothetical protein R1sor_005369 [Riccia sorocarpa]|uniref:Uncharacterized protein n=1 Tax=Riccia sorocarpa TaxID=122646 RepID=A0ABD3HJV1_9MARC
MEENRGHLSDEQLIEAPRRVYPPSTPSTDRPSVHVKIGMTECLKAIRRLAEKGIVSFYFAGEPAIGPFRSWVQANWGREIGAQIVSVQELGERAFLTTVMTAGEWDAILRNPYAPIRGCKCLVAHLPWTPDTEAENFRPAAKPIQVELLRVPKWAKEHLLKIFAKIGQSSKKRQLLSRGHSKLNKTLEEMENVQPSVQ